MGRILGTLLAALALVVVLAGPSVAASTTVAGTGAITKMSVNNGATAVVTKIYGPGGVNKVRWVTVWMKGTDGKTYQARGAWYGADWVTSLSRGTTLVKCGKLGLSYNGTGKFWRVKAPRTCLGKLTNKIKVRSDLASTVVATPGEAGPTKWLRRG